MQARKRKNTLKHGQTKKRHQHVVAAEVGRATQGGAGQATTEENGAAEDIQAEVAE